MMREPKARHYIYVNGCELEAGRHSSPPRDTIDSHTASGTDEIEEQPASLFKRCPIQAFGQRPASVGPFR